MSDYSYREDVARAKEVFADWRDVTFYHLPLSARVLHCLNNKFYGTTYDRLGEVADADDSTLLRIPNFGRISLREVRDVVAAYHAYWPLIQNTTDDAALQADLAELRRRVTQLEDDNAKLRGTLEAIRTLARP